MTFLFIQGIRKCRDHDEDLRRRKLEFNFPIGSKIFVVPNHPCELIVGEVIDYTEICLSKQVVPVYKNLNTGEICFTHNPSYWNQDLEDAIRDLPWWKRWNIVHPSHPYTEGAAKYLEANGTFNGYEEPEA